MKRLLLAAVLLPAAVRAESAPSDEAKASIMKAVRDGMTAREAMRVAIRARDAASDDPEIALLQWTVARTAQSEMKSNFDLAIHLSAGTLVKRAPRSFRVNLIVWTKTSVFGIMNLSGV